MPERTAPGGARPQPGPPDWRRLVREQLGRPGLSGEREAEVVEELAGLLEDACQAAGVDVGDGEAVRRWVEGQGGWAELARELTAGESQLQRRRRQTAAPPAPLRRRGMTGWGTDLRGTLRAWAHRPLFAVVAVVTLAVAIGLNTAVFSLVDAILLRPPPVADPDSLVRVYSSEPEGFMPRQPMSYPDFADLREHLPGLSTAFAHTLTQIAVEVDGQPELAFGELVSGGYFPGLGLQPAAGRLLGEEDDRLGDPAPVVVLSHGLWSRRFAADPGVVGRTVRVNGQPLTIVGVAPAGFRGLLRGFDPELWIPLTLGDSLGASSTTASGRPSRDLDVYHDRGRGWLWVVGRRAPGAGFEAARAEIAGLGTRLAAEYPESNEKRTLVTLPLVEVKVLPGVDQGIRLASAVLLGLVGIVLLIACANLANLLLARALGRRREIATRLALGASRGQIARQVLLESLLLAVAGGALGLLVALEAKALFAQVRLGGLPITLGLEIDTRVLLFTLGASLAAALVCGLAPVLETLRSDLAGSLHEGERGGAGRRRRRLQSALVAAQVGFSTILLVCGGLALRSVVHANRIDPGFDGRGVAALRLDLDVQGYDDERSAALFDRLTREAAALPGVAAVSQASHLPLSLWINTWSFATGSEEEGKEIDLDTATVGPRYFETLGIPILAGRDFTPWDREDGPRVAVVNEAFARRYWPGEGALGKHLHSGKTDFEIVGVVATGRYRTLGEEPRPFVYVSFGQYPAEGRNLLVRFRPGVTPDYEALRRLVTAADSHLAISNLSPLAEVTRPARLLPQAGSALFGLFGLLGLGLASLGLYGVLAYAVAQRTHEIGVRVALGAARRDVLAMVMRQGLLLTGAAALVGLGVAALLTGLLRSILYGVSPHDPATFVAVGVSFLAVATLACLLPARRATAIDPMEALRSD
jgi:putative ABC transport system permease protein